MAAIGVIIAVAARDEGELAAAIDAHPRLAVVRRCADLAEAVGAARAGVAGAVVVAEQPRLTRDSVAALLDSGVAVIGVPSTPEAGEQLRAVGLGTVVPAGADAQVVANEIVGAMALRAAVQPRAQDGARDRGEPGTLVAVWGPAGAPGRTTIAVNLAAEHARRGSRTLVVDADVYGGAVAQALGLTDEVAGVAGAVREAQHGSIDAAIIERHSIEALPGLWALTGITRAERWAELAPSATTEVLRAACRAFDAVVVDVGFSLESAGPLGSEGMPERNGVTLAVLAVADHVVAVGGAEPLSMQRLIHGIGALRESMDGEPTVVVNKVRADVAGPRPAEAVADLLARFASVDRIRVVPWDPAACDAAAMTGRVLAECAPRSKARKAIAGLAEAVLPASATSAPPRRPRMATAPVGH
ncbi:AAA family ATPase [Demequina activiva]|uniref:Pilus biosynthesis protein CpaE n=1 Tax=Demequina activiva TaxID=1582364 RepID=A0A919Q588_9MICO|nr:AAA family ATPase [Demequina activiva]GIG55412.1 pilus biosynthesis protein CpaE [Demequina activiva]